MTPEDTLTLNSLALSIAGIAGLAVLLFMLVNIVI